MFLVSLNPTRGAEIQKTRPCVVVSPNEMNQYFKTVIVAPMTSTLRGFPSRIPVTFQGKKGEVILDQLRTVDKVRLVKPLGCLPESTATQVYERLVEMFRP